jgi:Holliday junction resolvase RusA-like endonuclease
MKPALVFTVYGNPLPKQSTRFDGRGHAHTDPRITAWARCVEWAAQQAVMEYPNWQMFEGDIVVCAEFVRGNKKRVDLDNLFKNLADPLNGLVWKDDSLIVDLHIKKSYDAGSPRINVMIFEKHSENV